MTVLCGEVSGVSVDVSLTVGNRGHRSRPDLQASTTRTMMATTTTRPMVKPTASPIHRLSQAGDSVPETTQKTDVALQTIHW